MTTACSTTLALVLSISTFAVGQTQKTTPTNAAPKQKQSASFVDKLLKFLGISDAPGTLKGPGDEVRNGQLWVADLGSRKTHAVTENAGYRSPVFIAASADVLALKGTNVWRFLAGSSPGKRLYSVDGITKLVASSTDAPDEVLVLQSGGPSGHPRVGLLSISTGKVTPVTYDATAGRNLQMVENLQGWTRVYGNRRVYVEREAKNALSGKVEWTDVFLSVNGQKRVDVSQCNGMNCGQPSMSSDGQLVVFVKASTE
jgi:hypothetical protein